VSVVNGAGRPHDDLQERIQASPHWPRRKHQRREKRLSQIGVLRVLTTPTIRLSGRGRFGGCRPGTLADRILAAKNLRSNARAMPFSGPALSAVEVASGQSGVPSSGEKPSLTRLKFTLSGYFLPLISMGLFQPLR